MAAQAWFTSSEVPITPGQLAHAELTILNLGDTTETFAIVPNGLAAGWTTLRPATITLFGGSQGQVDVEINPPLLPSTSAGSTALTIRVVPQNDPDDVASTEATLLIAANHDRRVTLLQPALRARRKAIYEVMVDNQGNTQASCRMRIADSSSRVEADFDPPAIGVEPGASTLVKMKLRSSHLQWERRSRTIQFTVEAEQSGCPTASSMGTFVQAPVVPERFWGRLFSLAFGAAALAGIWFGLLRPEIRNVARDEAAAAVGNLPAQVATTVVAAPTTIPTQQSEVERLQGVTQRLEAQAAVGETISAVYEVPAGFTFLLTDSTLQNQQADSGTAVLLRDNETLLQWDLDNVQIDSAYPWITPVEVPAGSKLSFQVTCAGAGDGLGTCRPALLIGGKLKPVE